LLQVISGILQPTTGRVVARGRIAALLELGAGFNPEFSGRDNVYMNAAILGLSTREIDRRFDSIAEFAEIGEFMSQPVKTYSSGMAMRLGFAVAIHVDPEVLLVDEALAVGDVCFRQRCLSKVEQLRKRGVTIFFVSHSVGDVKNVGDRGLWLERGVVRDIGPVERVVNHYLAAMTEKDHRYRDEHSDAGGGRPDSGENELRPVTSIPNIDHRHGDGRARIVGAAVLNNAGAPAAFLEPRSEIAVRVSVQAESELSLPVAGVVIRNHLGVEFCATNTTREGLTLAPLNTVWISVPCTAHPGCRCELLDTISTHSGRTATTTASPGCAPEAS
jgi:ABC-type polysaccharide/polyol phosphate transport system ATPase subunit